LQTAEPKRAAAGKQAKHTRMQAWLLLLPRLQQQQQKKDKI
jgi:hypothetical protein